MGISRALINGSLLYALIILTNHAHALVIDFESTGIESISNTYAGSNYEGIATLENVAFYLDGTTQIGGTNGIYFSGGVLLDNPSEIQEQELQDITGGTVLYGTGDSPSTNVDSMGELTNKITIDIQTITSVTSVSGILINGLNTDSVNNPPPEVGFLVEYFSGNQLIGTDDFGFTNDDGLASGSVPGNTIFSLESEAITMVMITAKLFDFGGEYGATEWDFLIDNLSFNEAISFNEAVVPVPAALPLFVSALAGIGLFFRRK